MSVAKVIELVGGSEKSWEDAVKQALTRAQKTIHGIRGVEVTKQTAKVDDDGNIREYRAVIKISFQVKEVD